ncbi:Dyp-type peroxidase [Kitasatospora sp. A2-31]|uniref:Dyp-type peroxidase n=1 Tax=Kitasatospora sp. A2-31 TaxID=2916414 RepID=UPI001EEF33F2|nr:Dyp-type peroxidase [Kitasatospora sp. A2-31]MCG6499523.1 Dyp-type peroxidase [Kitasatospora sp. A2-31]
MTTTPTRPTTVPSIEQLPQPKLRTNTDIQGNILAAFNKDFTDFRYLHFPDAAKGRGWLSAILNTVATTNETEDFNEQYSFARRASGRDPALATVRCGVSLTFEGLLTVAVDPDQVKKDLSGFPAFCAGAAARAEALGDAGESGPEHWLFGSGTGDKVVHAVLIVAADTDELLNEKLKNLDAVENAHQITRVHVDQGRTLTGPLKGHEHFGYKDGISQPGVKDFHREDPDNKGFRDNHAGTELIEPGEFVFGHKSEAGDRTAPAWMTNGSLQVVRRLRQDVAGWNKAVVEGVENFTGTMDPNRLGACLVGRAKDGTPLAPPTGALTGLGSDRNDFDYENDPIGQHTPWVAHIRRTHPRAFAGIGDGKPKSHRLMRRGIPYGPEFPGGADDGKDRGLMFVCYGTSLEMQFELVQQHWANDPNFPPGDPTGAPHVPNGPDKVIGLAGKAEIGLADGTSGTVDMKRFVRTTGALYAFTPSISTLRLLAEGKDLPNKPVGS